MSNNRSKVRYLIISSYLKSMLAIFFVSVALMVLMGFDLEDQIFGYQIKQRADRLVTELGETHKPNGKVQAVEMSYFVGRENLPEWLLADIDPEWGVGAYEVFAREKGHFHLAIRTISTGEFLFLLFNARPYIKSTSQIKDYLKIIALMGGITLLISLYFTQKMAKRLSHPIERMTLALSNGGDANALDQIDTSHVEELQALVDAIVERDQRIQSLVDREGQFNRDMSHELRTPLTIATGAIELMEETQADNKVFLRLQSAVTDMQVLTEGVLWLGRDTNKKTTCNADRVCKRALETHKHMLRTDVVKVEVELESDVNIPVPEPVAFVIVGNILRNALTHTEAGKVTIRGAQGEITFDDTGVGFGNASDKNSGFGIGLSLVERLCQHFGLTFSISSGLEQTGSRVRVSWQK